MITTKAATVRRKAALATLAALVAGSLAPAAALPEAASGAGREAIVAFDAARRDEALRAIRARGMRVVRLLRGGSEALVMLPEGMTAREASARLDAGAIRFVAPNGKLRPAWTPNDPLYPKQWGLPMIGCPEAWDMQRGSRSVTVAVIDSGADLSHPDLKPNLDLDRDWDFVRSDAEADEEYAHGTHVAGIVAAATGNATGVAGVAPGVLVLPLKVIGRTGNATIADFVEAMRYAADMGARVINTSLGSKLDPAVPEEAAEIRLLQEAVDYARSKGALVVAAAGNGSGPPVWYPAACSGVVAVSAITRDGILAPYSSYGAEIDFAAPGGYAISSAEATKQVLSTWLGGGYAYGQGTSMAAPHVAGVAALLASALPSASPDAIETAMETSGRDIDEPGFDMRTGYGLVQAHAALERLTRVSRIGGEDRYATAAAASEAAFAAGSCRTVVIARGDDFPDALSASSLAGSLRAPVLLVTQRAVPSATMTEIRRLGATRAEIVGGPAAVGSDVVSTLEAAGLSVSRVGGKDRYDTARLVAQRVLESRMGTTTVLVARGDLFPDAAAASAPAAAAALPLVLVKPNEIPPVARQALAAAAPCEVVVIGGEKAIVPDVAREIERIPGVVGLRRWGGNDRYATAAAVATGALTKGLCARGLVAVATGEAFPDALTGGSAAGAQRGTVVLSRQSALPLATRQFVSGSLTATSTAWVLGGPAALSWQVQAELVRAMP